MAHKPIVIPVDDGPHKPPYPRGGLNGLQQMALDTGDADAMLEGLQQNEAVEVVGALPYHFNGGAQHGYIVTLYSKDLDPFYDDDPAVHPLQKTSIKA